MYTRERVSRWTGRRTDGLIASPMMYFMARFLGYCALLWEDCMIGDDYLVGFGKRFGGIEWQVVCRRESNLHQ